MSVFDGYAEPTPDQLAGFQPLHLRDFVALRTGQPDYWTWLDHIAPAAACTRPIRLAGDLYTVRGTADGGAQVVAHTPTDSLPDHAIYKPCGNRRANLCPACARTYQRDAFHLIRAGLVGGKGVPATIAAHPSAFVTLTAPSFGTVHTRFVNHHTCTNRARCTCRPEPCHPRRATGLCQHHRPAVCWARHEPDDPVLGQPLCLDCYDHEAHIVWHGFAGELWRRTTIAITRYLAMVCRQRGIPPVIITTASGNEREVPPVRLAYGKVAEFQTRGAVHFHAVLRLDGVDPDDPTAVPMPPAGISSGDLHDAITDAATHTTFSTPEHPNQQLGWPIGWGEQLDIRPINVTGRDPITDTKVAGYLAKYATKTTEAATGRQLTRLDPDNIEHHADPNGDHIARLIDACWRLGNPAPPPASYRPWTCRRCRKKTRLPTCPSCTRHCQPTVDTRSPHDPPSSPYLRLRRWAHMLGFGGHFLTKARRYSTTFQLLRAARTVYRRAETSGPELGMRTAEHLDEETTLIVGVLTFAGTGWRTIGDAALANTAAAMARARAEAARDELAHEIGSQLIANHPVAA